MADFATISIKDFSVVLGPNWMNFAKYGLVQCLILLEQIGELTFESKGMKKASFESGVYKKPLSRSPDTFFGLTKFFEKFPPFSCSLCNVISVDKNLEKNTCILPNYIV